MTLKERVLAHVTNTFTGEFFEYTGNLLFGASDVAEALGTDRCNASRTLNELVYSGELVKVESVGETVPTEYGFRPPYRVVYFVHRGNVNQHNKLITDAALAGEWDAKTRVDKAHEYGVHFSLLKRPPIKETNKYRLIK